MMKPTLRDVLDETAADLWEAGRHNEAEFLEELAERTRDINFKGPNYNMHDALEILFDEGDDKVCTCDRCPNCGGLLE